MTPSAPALLGVDQGLSVSRYRAATTAGGRGNRAHAASSTQISSSSASHRNARPPTRSCTVASSAGEALASRGYLLVGKLTILWSTSSSQTRRPSIQHRTAAAAGDVASVSMHSNVRQGQLFPVLRHEPFDVPQLRRPESEVGRQGHRIKPKLRFGVVACHMNMRWLLAFPAVEMEPVGPDPHDRRHVAILPAVLRLSNGETAFHS